MGHAGHELAEGSELLAAANGFLQLDDGGRLAQRHDGARGVVVGVAVPARGDIPGTVALGVVRLRVARLLAVADRLDALGDRDPRLFPAEPAHAASQNVRSLPAASKLP